MGDAETFDCFAMKSIWRIDRLWITWIEVVSALYDQTDQAVGTLQRFGSWNYINGLLRQLKMSQPDINNYFNYEIKNGNKLYLENILNYKKALDPNSWTAALGVIFHNLKRSWAA